jgi:hypothetical protein
MLLIILIGSTLGKGIGRDSSSSNTHRTRDVCVLGAGAGGMSTAVFLKDRGYDVLVIEKEDDVGGNCNTEMFTPSDPNDPDWIDIGVQAYLDTQVLNVSGVGTWTLDSREFVKRFIEEENILPYNIPNRPIYGADFSNKINLGPLTQTEPPEFYVALEKYLAILATYPWISNGSFPDVIPSELLVTFDEFIATNQLEALIPGFFRSYIYNYRNKPSSNYTALSALSDAGQWVFLLQSNPNSAFRIKEGCIQLYDNMTNYLGRNNVIKNARVFSVDRTGNGGLITIRYMRESNHIVSANCRNLVVSFAPLLENLEALDLTRKEEKVFEKTSSFNLYPFAVNITTANPLLCVLNFNISNPTLIPSFPFVSNLCMFNPEGWMSGYFLNEGPKVSDSIIIGDINQQLSNIPSLFTSAPIVEVLDYHYLTPYFTANAFKNGKSPYKKIDELQGYKNTYWMSSLASRLDWSHVVWEHAHSLVDTYFPHKN